jgi:hypothetical protein
LSRSGILIAHLEAMEWGQPHRAQKACILKSNVHWWPDLGEMGSDSAILPSYPELEEMGVEGILAGTRTLHGRGMRLTNVCGSNLGAIGHK